MSRCFPFPPPGYAKKTRVEDIDVLAKEKHKEKKHKKEKKERSNKEGKEKKEKDKTNKKHKDKKDRKEKHKDKDKNKDKGQKPDGKNPELSSTLRNGEKFCPSSLQPLEPNDSKLVQELERKVKVGSNSFHQREIRDSKHVQELEKRIKYNEEASKSQSSEIFAELPGDKKEKNHAKIPETLASEKPQMGKSAEKFFHKQNGKETYGVKTDEKPPFSINEFKIHEGQEKKTKEKNAIKSNPLDFRNAKPPNCSVSSPSTVDTNVGKRKEPERNGYLFDEVIRSKITAKSFNDIESKTGDETRINNHGIAPKVPKVNGYASPHRQNEIPVKAPAAQKEIPVKAPAAQKEIGESSERVKSPHPDCKYLAQIFSVPTMEEMPESLDQSWLFSNEKAITLTPTSGVEIEEVWSKAVRIHSADISALPYVIPF